MSTPVTYVGNSYNIPAYQDTGYAQGTGNLSSYLIALATGSLTLSGGSFPLTADANFGGSFGLVALYFKSRTANVAAAGIIRLANTDTISWRNALNNADLALTANASNIITYAGTALAQSASTGITLSAAGAISLTAPVTIALGGTNSIAALANGKFMISSAGAIVEGPSTTLPVANGGTNSAASLNSNRFMVSSAGAIVEAAVIAASKVIGSDANGLPTSTGIGYGSTKFTGLSVGSATGDSATFDQLKVIQFVTATNVTGFTTTSSTYQTSNLSVAITPTSASNRVLVFAFGLVRNNAVQTTSALISIFRGSTDTLSAAGTIAFSSATATGNYSVTGAMMVLDSPATTAATTYSVKVKSGDNATTVGFGNGQMSVIVAIEVV